jgi:hypothetical protein
MGANDSLAVEAARMVAGLEKHLQIRNTVLTLDRINEPRIPAAVDWLRAFINPNGSWGCNSSTATCMCALGLTMWKQPGPDPQVEASCRWLLESSRDGAWETPWETAVALRTLERAGYGNHPISILGKKKVLALNPAEADLKPHHRAQILNLITELGAHDLSDPWIARCDADLPRTKNSPYIMGQIVHSLLSANNSSVNCDTALRQLKDFLLAGPPEAATFLPYLVTLQALACSGTEYQETVGVALDYIFTDAHRADGSWYHDPWYTGWAVCALHDVHAVRRLVIDAPVFAKEFRLIRDRLQELEKEDLARQRSELRSRRRVAIYAALVILFVTLGAVVLIEWQGNNPVFSSGLIVTVILGLLGVSWRGLWPLLRRRRASTISEMGDAG